MDGIAKLRGVNTWAYVQWNQFPSKCDDTKFSFLRCLRSVLVATLLAPLY